MPDHPAFDLQSGITIEATVSVTLQKMVSLQCMCVKFRDDRFNSDSSRLKSGDPLPVKIFPVEPMEYHLVFDDGNTDHRL